MGRKVIVLNGSPRAKGNTSALIAEFARGAREADVMVLATPLYYWNFSGQLRTAFDRLFAVAECDPNYHNPKKESVLLMAAEGYGFDDALTYYQNLMKHLGWTEAYELGKAIAQGNGL